MTDIGVIIAFYSFIATMTCLMILYAARIENVFNNRIKLIDAFRDYALYCIDNGTYTENQTEVLYSHMMSPDKAMLKMFHWGCEYMMPSEDFEKIRPFIRQ